MGVVGGMVIVVVVGRWHTVGVVDTAVVECRAGVVGWIAAGLGPFCLVSDLMVWEI